LLVLHWSSPLAVFDVRNNHAKEINVKYSLSIDESFVFSAEAKGMQGATVLYSPGYQFVLASKGGEVHFKLLLQSVHSH